MRKHVLPLNLYIDKKLRADLNKEAARQRRTIRAVVEEALRQILRKEA